MLVGNRLDASFYEWCVSSRRASALHGQFLCSRHAWLYICQLWLPVWYLNLQRWAINNLLCSVGFSHKREETSVPVGNYN